MKGCEEGYMREPQGSVEQKLEESVRSRTERGAQLQWCIYTTQL